MRRLMRLLAPADDACESVYLPERTGHRGDRLDPIVCTGQPTYDEAGKPTPHRGKHRTTLPGGVRLRWTDEETQSA